MTHRRLAIPLLLAIVVCVAARGGAQASEPAQGPTTAPTAAPPASVVTKDPEYLKLLNPPQGNEFLKIYSKAYRDKSAEIEATVAGVTEENLRSQARNDAWASALQTDGDKFQYEADIAFREAKISFSREHQGGLLEIGRVSYETYNKVLVVTPNPTAPIENNLRLAMNPATLNQVYEKFHAMAAQDIDRKAHEYVSNSGAGSNCSRNPDWCYQYAKGVIEESQRSERLVVVALGDLEAGKIDRLTLIDRDTAAVVLELAVPPSALNNVAWRFSVGPAPIAPAQPKPVEAQAQPAPAAAPEPAPTPAPPAPAPVQTMQAAKSDAISEPAPAPPTSSNAPPERVVVPANVTAASIVTQTRPGYPPQARAKRIQGEVVLHAIIDKEGKVSDVQILSGDDTLAQSAVESVRQWRYKPMLVDGEPKEVDTIVTVTFSLQE
jgi:TonB family protein